MDNLLKLVIADDEAYIRNSLKDLFPWEEMGYTVTATCSNGSSALDYLRQQGADVILTDIQMPVLNGIGLAKEIQETKLPVSIVLLSAHSDFEYARQGIQYGAIDYIMKPVSYEELVHVFTSLHNKLVVSGQPPENTDTISKITDYIKNNADHVTLEEAARHVGLSADYISRLFCKKTGISFAEFVYRSRMEQAGVLTRKIDLPINQIAKCLGYQNPKNFSRAFHNYYGMTPMEYRKHK